MHESGDDPLIEGSHPRRGDAGRLVVAEWRAMTLFDRPFTLLAIAAVSLTTTSAAQPPAQGVTYRSPSGITLRLILDDHNVGQEVSLGEMIFPPGIDSGDH